MMQNNFLQNSEAISQKKRLFRGFYLNILIVIATYILQDFSQLAPDTWATSARSTSQK